MMPSARFAGVSEFPFARWGRHCHAAKERGIDLIRLDIGNPDLPPPTAVIEAACNALRSPTAHGYPGYRGSPALRHAICEYYALRFDVSLDPETQVICLLGSKEGIVHLQQAILDPGDVVLLPDPGYAPYDAGAGLSQASIVRFPLTAKRNYVPDFDAIPAKVAQQAKAIWLNYPNNPTGAVASSKTLEQAVAFAHRHSLLLCHDAPYTDVRFDGCRPTSILQVDGASDVAIEFNSLSKTYNMAGWRIGYAVGNAEALGLLQKMKSNVDSGLFYPLQRAAVVALKTDEAWIEERNAIYRERLGILVNALTAAGLTATLPLATHYLWTRIPDGEKAEPFSLRLLNEIGIAVAPGTFFGPGGEGFVRISATASTDRIREATERLSSWQQAAPL
ncbi:aminotransferase class I/II-fold pyridoxal phosphate-dependent enzyme [bacterium]|nr:aminotransferase class I/II-fold pyridoxal phosphate-dependent enzyme [bacterium]